MGVALGRRVQSSLLRTVWCLYEVWSTLKALSMTYSQCKLSEPQKENKQHVITKIMVKNGALLVQVTLHFELEAAAVLQQVVSNAANRV